MMIAFKYLARVLLAILMLAALVAGAGAHAQTNGAAVHSDRGAMRKAPLPDEEQPYNDASFREQTVPPAMTAGAVYSVAVAMTNIGTTAWTSGASYVLGSQNPQDNVTWGGGRAALERTVRPGQIATFNFQVTAPNTPGTYDFQWKMVQDGVEWFGGATPNVAVTVTAPTAAPTISVSRTPATMVAGQAFTLTWSTTNATALSRSCSATGGGYAISDAPPTNGSSSDTASAAWIGYPSTCTWSASGPGGSATYTETMTTVGAVSNGRTVTYIHTDALGSPVARSDANGNVISRTRYEPYGATAAGVTPTIGFTGHVNDADTGLVYMQQRYYDPVAGRFLSVDPITTDADTGGGFNRYSYANNSPYRYIDPDGRDPVSVLARAAKLTVALGEDIGKLIARRSWRKSEKEAVDGAAKIGTKGGKICPECKNEVDKLDINHTKKWGETQHEIMDSIESGQKVTREEVRDMYGNAIDGKCPSCNRSDNKLAGAAGVVTAAGTASDSDSAAKTSTWVTIGNGIIDALIGVNDAGAGSDKVWRDEK
jgi:RHS repeat-associated protein